MSDTYAYLEYGLASTQCTCLMLGMGATLSARDFLLVFQRPSAIAWGVFGLTVLSPLLALGLILACGLAAPLAVGLILVSIMPGGSFSNVFTFLGRGNVVLSITLTAVMTLGSLVSVPLLLPVLAGHWVPAEFTMPTALIFRDVVLFLLIPLVVGMGCGRLWPEHKYQLATWGVRLGLVLTLGLIVASLTSGRIRPMEYGLWLPAIILGYLLLSQQLSMLPFRLGGWPIRDRFAVGMEVTARNINLAVLMKASLFPAAQADPTGLGDGVLFVILFYGGASLVLSVPFILIYRRLIGRAEAEPAAASESQEPPSMGPVRQAA